MKEKRRKKMNGIFNVKSKRGIIFFCYCLVILLTLCFIFGNSVATREESAEQSGAVSDSLKPVLDPKDKLTDSEFELLIRKTAHFSEFALLGFELALFAFHISMGFKLRDAIYSVSASLLLANCDELLQNFTERGSKVTDVFIDFGGAICGIVAGYIVAYIVRAIYRKAVTKKQKNN